jgi:hypothetical protein
MGAYGAQTAPRQSPADGRPAGTWHLQRPAGCPSLGVRHHLVAVHRNLRTQRSTDGWCMAACGCATTCRHVSHHHLLTCQHASELDMRLVCRAYDVYRSTSGALRSLNAAGTSILILTLPGCSTRKVRSIQLGSGAARPPQAGNSRCTAAELSLKAFSGSTTASMPPATGAAAVPHGSNAAAGGCRASGLAGGCPMAGGLLHSTAWPLDSGVHDAGLLCRLSAGRKFGDWLVGCGAASGAVQPLSLLSRLSALGLPLVQLPPLPLSPALHGLEAVTILLTCWFAAGLCPMAGAEPSASQMCSTQSSVPRASCTSEPATTCNVSSLSLAPIAPKLQCAWTWSTAQSCTHVPICAHPCRAAAHLDTEGGVPPELYLCGASRHAIASGSSSPCACELQPCMCIAAPADMSRCFGHVDRLKTRKRFESVTMTWQTP